MATIKGNLKLTNLEEVKKSILRILADEVNQKIKKNSQSIEKRTKVSIERWIREQPEISSLLSEGEQESLNAHFGIPLGSSDNVVDVIVRAIVSSVRVKIQGVSKTFTGGYVEISYNGSEMYNLLKLPEGHVITNKGTDLHWLNWLLTMGDSIIVIGYHYVPERAGRSGGGTMSGGISWRVPPQFSGTIDDNFITRAMTGRERELETILGEVLK